MRFIFIISTILAAAIVLSCQRKSTTDAPLAVVVKYVSAEVEGLKEEARPYIDLQSVYSKHIKDAGVDYEKVWEDQMEFRRNVKGSIKMKSCFSFYEYDIDEVLADARSAVVTFKSRKEVGKNSVYGLTFINEKWIIVSIDHLENE